MEYPHITLKGHRLETATGQVPISHAIIEIAIPGVFDPKKGHCVHHVDGDVNNSGRGNLVVCQDQAYHLLLHQRQRSYNTCGHTNWRPCVRCKKHDDISNMRAIPNKSYFNYEHKECKAKYERERKQKLGGKPGIREKKMREYLELSLLLEKD